MARQEKIFNRYGIGLPRNTLANWVIRCCQLVQPLLNLMKDHLCSGPMVQHDEASVQVLKEPNKPAESKSYLWVCLGGLADEPAVLYDYHPSYTGTLLSGFSG